MIYGTNVFNGCVYIFDVFILLRIAYEKLWDPGTKKK